MNLILSKQLFTCLLLIKYQALLSQRADWVPRGWHGTVGTFSFITHLKRPTGACTLKHLCYRLLWLLAFVSAGKKEQIGPNTFLFFYLAGYLGMKYRRSLPCGWLIPDTQRDLMQPSENKYSSPIADAHDLTIRRGRAGSVNDTDFHRNTRQIGWGNCSPFLEVNLKS